MKRKVSIQPILIVGTLLLIAIIVFSLTKSGILEKDTGKGEVPPVADITEDEELIDDVEFDENEEDIGEEEGSEIGVGKLAPDFTLKNLEGEEVSLSDYRGKIVFLNFWATWCPFCDKEMPDLNKLDAENEDVVVLAVDVMEDKKLVEDYIEKGGYDFQVVLDEDGQIAMKYLINPLPTTYFIDEEGILLGRIEGMLTWAHMNEILENIREFE